MIKVLEKVEMLEIKQGPFLGDKDKIRLKNFEKIHSSKRTIGY